MKIATWNIYWLGDRSGKISRDSEDEQLISQVIRNLSPDVLALEEIVDPLVMQGILGQASGDGRNYIIRSGDGNWLTSDNDPTDVNDGGQKVFLCINDETVEFIRGAAVRGGPPGHGFRRPYAALLRHRESGERFVVVAVHLRSGYPNFLDKADAEARRNEATALAGWLNGEAAAENPGFERPGEGKVVVLGDFNAEYNHPGHTEPRDPNASLDPLREKLPGWNWEYPEPDGQRWETAIYNGDRFVIDYIILSPEAAGRVEQPPKIYAWDQDPALGGPAKFHHGPGGSGDLKGYGVSDHRPVFTVLDF